MTLAALNHSPTPRSAADLPGRTDRPEPAGTGVGATLAGIATAASDGVSATVSFSAQALHALEHAGESTLDALADGASSVAGAAGAVLGGAEDLAVGAWHAIRHAAVEVEHLAESGWDELKNGLASVESAGEAVADAVSDGVGDVVSATKTAAQHLGHYAAAAVETTGDAVSEVASGAVFAAAAGGKTLLALL